MVEGDAHIEAPAWPEKQSYVGTMVVYSVGRALLGPDSDRIALGGGWRNPLLGDNFDQHNTENRENQHNNSINDDNPLENMALG